MTVDRSLVKKTARELRRLSLACEPGTLLGSEKELIERLGVSRPTFRQAAKMVENEQLLSISRGVKGGFYSRQPEISAVLHAASVYLMTRKNTLADLLVAMSPLHRELSRLAARCNDELLREELVALYRKWLPGEFMQQTHTEFHVTEGELFRLLYRMCENPSLELVMRVLYQFGIAGKSLFENRDDLMQMRRSTRLRLIRAIIDRDEEVAVLMTQRSSRELGPHISGAMLEQKLDLMKQ
jgi:DNA-binding FadR family transcriptional regulator